MEKFADLHVHTVASDGAFTPTQAVEYAAKAGLAAIAISDHDTVGGIDEAIEAGKSLGVEVVPAIEISTMHGDKTEVHVLGYFFDHHNLNLLETLEVLRNARWERGRQMAEKLNLAGVPVSFERIVELAAGGAIGRPHVDRAICETGVAFSMDSAFGKYLNEGGAGFVARYKVTPFEAIKLIRSAGGVACCAHPVKLKNMNLLNEMIAAGMQAIEVYHPDHTSAISRFYRRFAEKRGLIITGGSDAHCFPNDTHPGIGDVSITYDTVIELKLAAEAAARLM